MSRLVRRYRRLSVRAAVVAAGTLLATAATAAPAAAVGGGFDPRAAPVTIPGTSTVVNEWKLERPVALLADTPANTRFLIRAREVNTAGVSPWTATVFTYVPLAAPLPPTSLTLTPHADGTFTLSFTPAPADPDPAGAILSGFRPHAPATGGYRVEARIPGDTQPEDLDFLSPDQTSDTIDLAGLGIPAGTYPVSVIAQNADWVRRHS